ncbi:PDC sensor domain-containing protein [Sulfurovum sp. zt1-1]|uniref:PDC sensor domain-containing protein n=1 Tax=Sulfurovum zhangzhouensis TaxID=3019067 RepID=A0ABT7QYA6_9BACT|nr:PDC sensor domain-containing protein [Sulfurovum zhangzhouensis]MDM5271777.1 PDC sensor domain-containing protein [Sulfurovum zhangzhouensis]
MVIKEIQEYAQIRTKARAYLCYILSRNISKHIEGGIEQVIRNIDSLQKALPQAEAIYVLDGKGEQVIDNVSNNETLKGFGKGEDRSNRAYYYRTMSEHRCILTDPYPSLVSNHLVVTSTFPIYDQEGKLLYIICVDINLRDILRMVHPSSVDSSFGTLSKVVYAAFSAALFAVAILLFFKGISSFMGFGFDISKIDINEMFKATILLTLSLAIVDLVKAIFEEEVLGHEKKENRGDSHQTMVRFLGSIIIALSIEALMLVFKFAITDPSHLMPAVYLIGAVTTLIIGLSIYLKFSRDCVDKEGSCKKN